MKLNTFAIIGALSVLISAVPTAPARPTEVTANLMGRNTTLIDPSSEESTCGQCFDAYITCCAEDPKNIQHGKDCNSWLCLFGGPPCQACGYTGCLSKCDTEVVEDRETIEGTVELVHRAAVAVPIASTEATATSTEVSAVLDGIKALDLAAITAMDASADAITCASCFNSYITCCAGDPSSRWMGAMCEWLVCQRGEDVCWRCGYNNCK